MSPIAEGMFAEEDKIAMQRVHAEWPLMLCCVPYGMERDALIKRVAFHVGRPAAWKINKGPMGCPDDPTGCRHWYVEPVR